MPRRRLCRRIPRRFVNNGKSGGEAAGVGEVTLVKLLASEMSMPNRKAPPLIVAHRGLHHLQPENSLAAFRAAWAAGIEWCECDVQLTHDGVPVVLHDETLDRTTTFSGLVSEISYDALLNCCLRTASGSHSNEKLPLLFDVLRAMAFANHQASLLFELKPADDGRAVRGIVDILRQLKDRERCMFQSFDETNVLSAHQADAAQPVALLVETAETLRAAPTAPWSQINAKYDLIDQSTLAELRKHGKRVGVWTPNTEPALRRVIELGVDMIITDEPLLARRLVEEMRG
jgi:glycerophosphoryl diester phosphodiesterase